MRRDVYIENDSGGFSVLAADAVDAIIDDARGDDAHFVTTHKAILLELYGDDSMPVRNVVDEVYFLHWIAGLTTDTTPRFELWVQPVGAWTPPPATPDFAVVPKGAVTAIGPVVNTGGWHTWWTSRDVAKALGSIPDGSTIDLAVLPDDAEREDPTSLAGRALYSGTVSAGAWHVSEASPRVSRDTLEQALTFLRELLLHNRMHVREGSERQAFDAVAEVFSPGEGSLRWEGDVVSLSEPDERMHLILSPPVFRARFGDLWPMDAEEEDDGRTLTIVSKGTTADGKPRLDTQVFTK